MIDIDHDDTILRTFLLLAQTAQALLKYTDVHLYRKARISSSRFTLLQALSLSSGKMRPSEVAERMLRERHNITTLVHRLERDGLVRTERDNRDKRYVNIILTDEGRKVLSQAIPVARDIMNQVMLSISEGDAVLLEKLLRVLRQNAHYGLEHAAKRSQPQPG